MSSVEAFPADERLTVEGNDAMIEDTNFESGPVTPGQPQPQQAQAWKRAPCRYGRGCTHTTDEAHCARYWHPSAIIRQISPENYICNECGCVFSHPRELKFHMQRKTAWSNRSLVGCHVSVLLDSRDWQDGVVTQYHKSGKHCVEFHVVHQKRWLPMLKTAFYIVERPKQAHNSESKEAEEQFNHSQSNNGGADAAGGSFPEGSVGGGFDAGVLAPIDKWAYCEEISLDYAKAQSTIHRVYGNKIQETGHRTEGHTCVSEEDKAMARTTKGSLLYGELLPRGVNRALDSKHLDACRPNCHSLLDLGMGTGKVVMQVFLQCPNLTFVYGVELSLERYRKAEAAALRLVEMVRMDSVHGGGSNNNGNGNGNAATTTRQSGSDGASSSSSASPPATVHFVPRFEVAQMVEGKLLRIRDRKARKDGKERVLHLEWANLLEAAPFVSEADFVLLETDIPSDTMLRLACLLYLMKAGSRILSYLDLSKVWEGSSSSSGSGSGSSGGSGGGGGGPFAQLDANRSLADRYPTSWSVHRGHHFYVSLKASRGVPNMLEYYTTTRRLNPEAPPPYPTYSSSIFRSFVPSSMFTSSSSSSSAAATAAVRGGGGGGSLVRKSERGGGTTDGVSGVAHGGHGTATAQASQNGPNGRSDGGGHYVMAVTEQQQRERNARRALAPPPSMNDMMNSGSTGSSAVEGPPAGGSATHVVPGTSLDTSSSSPRTGEWTSDDGSPASPSSAAVPPSLYSNGGGGGAGQGGVSRTAAEFVESPPRNNVHAQQQHDKQQQPHHHHNHHQSICPSPDSSPATPSSPPFPSPLPVAGAAGEGGPVGRSSHGGHGKNGGGDRTSNQHDETISSSPASQRQGGRTGGGASGSGSSGGVQGSARRRSAGAKSSSKSSCALM